MVNDIEFFCAFLCRVDPDGLERYRTLEYTMLDVHSALTDARHVPKHKTSSTSGLEAGGWTAWTKEACAIW